MVLVSLPGTGEILSFGGDLLGGIFGGGLKACEEYAGRAASQAESVSPTAARRAWDAIGDRTAQRILSFPPLSSFCPTDNVPIACSDDLDESSWRSAGGFEIRGDAARVLQVAGVETNSGCTKEHIELAKIVLSKASGGDGFTGVSQGATTGTSSPAPTSEPGLLERLFDAIVQPGLDEIEARAQGAAQGAATGAQAGARRPDFERFLPWIVAGVAIVGVFIAARS